VVKSNDQGQPAATGCRGFAVRVAVGLVVGALCGFSEVALSPGLVLAGAASLLLVKSAGDSWRPTLGGFLVGIGGMVSYGLGPALTNRDPAVTYSASTVPVLLIAAAVGIAGAGLVAAGGWKAFHHG
jgi:hypothetical protein